MSVEKHSRFSSDSVLYLISAYKVPFSQIKFCRTSYFIISVISTSISMRLLLQRLTGFIIPDLITFLELMHTSYGSFIYSFFKNNQLKNCPYGIRDTFKLAQAGKFMFLAIFMYLFPSFISHKNVTIISREISITRFLYLYNVWLIVSSFFFNVTDNQR